MDIHVFLHVEKDAQPPMTVYQRKGKRRLLHQKQIIIEEINI